VIELVKGRDDQVCGARAQVLNNERKPSVLRRPIQRLIPIEVTSRDQEQSTETLITEGMSHTVETLF